VLLVTERRVVRVGRVRLRANLGRKDRVVVEGLPQMELSVPVAQVGPD
jgi:hypothetical protein